MRATFVAAGAAAVLVAGCTAVTSPNGGMAGGGMMGGDSAYRYSALTCSAPAGLPEPTVTVMLGDMGTTRMMGGTAPLGAHMMLRAVPVTLPAGTITFVVTNMGWRTHELVILHLETGDSAGQRPPGSDGTIDETGSVGEASASCGSGAGDGIEAGTVGWTTLTLSPGRYELVCNLPHHYADGMHQEFVVTA